MATALRIAIAVLVLLLAAVAVLLTSDRALFRTGAYLIETLTPYRLVLDAPSLDLGERRLRAASARLYQRGADAAPLVAVEGLEVRDALGFLWRGDLRGTDVHADSVLAWVDRSDGTADPRPEDWLRQTRWLPRTLGVGILHVITRGETVYILPLKALDGRWNTAGHFALAGAADYKGEPLEFAIDLRKPAGAMLELGAVVTAPESESTIEVNGDVEASGDDLAYRLALQGDYREVEAFLRALDEEAYGFAGHLTLKGELAGNLQAASLDIEQLSLDNTPAYRFAANGDFSWARGRPIGLDLVAEGSLMEANQLTAFLGTDLSALGRIDAALSLGGSLAEPLVRRMTLTSRSDEGLAVSLSPEGRTFVLAEGVPEDLALAVTVSGPDLASLSPWVELPSIPSGAWTAAGTLERRPEGLALRSLQARIDDLPGGGTLRASGDIDALRPGVDKGPRFEGLGLSIAVDRLDPGPVLAALGSELALPAPLSIRGSAQLAGDAGSLRAEAIDAAVDALGGEVRVSGTVDRLSPLGSADLRLEPSGIEVTALAAALAEPGTPAPAGGRIDGSARLLGDGGDWSLEEIDLALAGWPILDLTLSGTAQHLLAGPRAQLEARYTVKQPPEPAGLSLPPGDGTAVIDLQPQRQLLGLHALLGESDVTAIFEVNRDGGRISGFRGEVDAPRLHLPDLAQMSESDALAAEHTTDGQKTRDSGGLLTRLPAYPVRLRLGIGEITGTNLAARDFAVLVVGRDRRLTLESFDVNYAGGSVQLRGVADLSGETPVASLAGIALGVPVTAIARDLGYGGEIEGTLSLRGGMTAQGAEGDALLASLNGNLAAAVADGFVAGAAFDLLMTDLVSWLLLGGILQDNTNFECAMASFDFRDGVARSDSLYMATKNMIAGGEAMLDFPASRVDIRIDPRARSRAVQIPSSVRIRGPMADPAIIPSPIAATFDASAKLLFFVPELALRMLGADFGGDKDQPTCAPVVGAQ